MSHIPPQGARLLGAWPTASQPQRHTRTRVARRARLARLLHPLHRPVELPDTEPTTTQAITTARHA